MALLHTLEFEKSDAANHLRADEDGGFHIVCPDNHGHFDGEFHDVSLEEQESYGSGTASAAEGSILSEPSVANAAVSLNNPPAYNSKPGAARHIYLDFNGAVVSGKAWSASSGGTTCRSWNCAAWGHRWGSQNIQ